MKHIVVALVTLVLSIAAMGGLVTSAESHLATQLADADRHLDDVLTARTAESRARIEAYLHASLAAVEQAANGASTPPAKPAAPDVEKALAPFQARLTAEEKDERSLNRAIGLLYAQAGQDPAVAQAQQALNAAIASYISKAIEEDAALKAERDAFLAAVAATNKEIVIALGGDPAKETFDRVAKAKVPLPVPR